MASNLKKGLTIVELLVTISIATVLMAIVAFNYGSSNDNLAIASAAQEMAVTIRQAQSYALGVREVAQSGGVFTAGYGIFVDITTPTEYILFADAPVAPPIPGGNNTYDAGSGCGSGSTECVERLVFRNGIVIDSIDAAVGTCPSSNAARTLNIVFLRPDPELTLRFVNNGGGTICASETTAKIVLRSPKNKTVNIVLDKSGQISIQ